MSASQWVAASAPTTEAEQVRGGAAAARIIEMRNDAAIATKLAADRLAR